LIEAVAIIMFHAEDDEVMRWIFDEIEKGGKNIEVQEWLGRTIKEDGVEMSGCNDPQGHSLHMHEDRLVLAFSRRRAYTGHVMHARQAREERDLRASHISLVSHMSCILTSLLSI
jgi:hypothetical protein